LGRFPRRVGGLLQSAIGGGSSAQAPLVDALLVSASQSGFTMLVESLADVDALMRAPAATLMALRRELYRRLLPGEPGFPKIHELFNELEERCAKVRPG
jgi:hypothetical protein